MLGIDIPLTVNVTEDDKPTWYLKVEEHDLADFLCTVPHTLGVDRTVNVRFDDVCEWLETAITKIWTEQYGWDAESDTTNQQENTNE